MRSNKKEYLPLLDRNIEWSLYDIQDYHASRIEAAQAANEANVKELIFYHLTPAPQNFIAKIIFVRGVNEVRPDNWTLADDGTMAILPIESEDITITNIQ